MTKIRIWPLLLVIILCFGGCGDDDDAAGGDADDRFYLESTIPAQDLTGVDIHTAIVFHFNQPLDSTQAHDDWAFVSKIGDEDAGRIEGRLAVSGSNVVFKPLAPLTPNRRYMAGVSTLVQNQNGQNPEQTGPEMAVAFKTGGGLPLGDALPKIASVRPADSGQIYDWTTFHIDLSEPVDTQKTVYGEQIVLRKAGTDSAVPSQMFLKDSRIIIDPDSDLIPGQTYELALMSNLRDAYWENLGNTVIKQFQVSESKPRKIFALGLCPTRKDRSPCDPVTTNAAMPDSPFSGEKANSIVLQSGLFGRVQYNLTGFLELEMGDVEPGSPTIPIMARKGQRIYAYPEDENENTGISAQLSAGPLKLILLADAGGFISDRQAPSLDKRILSFELEMSFGLNADDTVLNALVGGCEPRIRLSGNVVVNEDGAMVLDGAGYASTKVFTDTLDLAVSISAATTDSRQWRLIDTEPPSISSSYPSDYESRFPLGETLKLVFNEPVDPSNINENTSLIDEDGNSVSGRSYIEGSALYFKPSAPLQPDTQYRLELSGNISDLSGNRIEEGAGVFFKSGPTQATSTPPLIASIDPPPDSNYVRPGNFPVRIHFTQLMDTSYFIQGYSIRIQDAETGEDVPGIMEITHYDVAFRPNGGFEAGKRYRVTLNDEIRNYIGTRLDIDGDGVAAPDEAFASIKLYEFTVAEDDRDAVPVAFRVTPVTDADGSGYVDENESAVAENRMTVSSRPFFSTSTYLSGQFFAYLGPVKNGIDAWARSIVIPDGIKMFGASMEILDTPFAQGLETGRVGLSVMEAETDLCDESRSGYTVISPDLSAYFQVDDGQLNQRFSHEYQMGTDIVFSFDDVGRLRCDFAGNGTMNYFYPPFGFDIPVDAAVYFIATSISP